MNLTVWGLGHHFVSDSAFLRNDLTSKLPVRRPSTTVHYFALMPLSLWDEITTFSGLSAPERTKMQCLFCSGSHPGPES